MRKRKVVLGPRGTAGPRAGPPRLGLFPVGQYPRIRRGHQAEPQPVRDRMPSGLIAKRLCDLTPRPRDRQALAFIRKTALVLPGQAVQLRVARQ